MAHIETLDLLGQPLFTTAEAGGFLGFKGPGFTAWLKKQTPELLGTTGIVWRIGHLLAQDDALSVAIEERTGRPGGSGEQGTPEDVARAEEIFDQYGGDKHRLFSGEDLIRLGIAAILTQELGFHPQAVAIIAEDGWKTIQNVIRFHEIEKTDSAFGRSCAGIAEQWNKPSYFAVSGTKSSILWSSTTIEEAATEYIKSDHFMVIDVMPLARRITAEVLEKLKRIA